VLVMFLCEGSPGIVIVGFAELPLNPGEVATH